MAIEIPARDTADLASYAELADVLAAAPLLLRETRRARRLSLRAAAEQIGCSGSTLYRYETGGTGVASDTLIAIVRWLDAAPQPAPGGAG